LKLKFIWRIKQWQKQAVVSTSALLIFQVPLRSLAKAMEAELSMQRLLYIVRPSFNLLGMGRFARNEWIEQYTDHIHPAEFWCEIFEGEHLSVDFHHQESELVVLGTKDSSDPYYKWQKWEKIDQKVDFPEILKDLKGDYAWINCEFIGGKLIEVHFRRNPDFRYGNSVAIPVWDDEKKENMTFIEDQDYLRKGFYIK